MKDERNWFSLSMLIFTVVSLCMAGCGGGYLAGRLTRYDHEVKPQRYEGSFEPGRKYALTKSVFLLARQDDSRTMVLVPQDKDRTGGYWESPQSIAEYQARPEDWPDVLAIIDAGTEVRCEAIRRSGALFWGSEIYVVATLLHGDYKGELIDLSELIDRVTIDESHARKRKSAYPDPAFLHEVS